MFDGECVVHSGGRIEVLLVGLGEGVVVNPQQRWRLGLSHALDQDACVLIGPRSCRGCDALLQIVLVEGRDSLADGNVHDEVQAREHRLGNAGGELDRDPTEGFLQDRLDLQTDRGGVAVTGQVDQAGQEASVVIGAHVEPGLAALLKVHDRFGELREEIVVNLEELIARVGLQKLQ